jgi:hypothetical protein
MAKIIAREIKREGQKKAKRQKRRELIPLVVGNYFTHYPSNVIQMLIVRFNNNKRFTTHHLPMHQCNLPFSSKS